MLGYGLLIRVRQRCPSRCQTHDQTHLNQYVYMVDYFTNIIDDQYTLSARQLVFYRDIYSSLIHVVRRVYIIKYYRIYSNIDLQLYDLILDYQIFYLLLIDM